MRCRVSPFFFILAAFRLLAHGNSVAHFLLDFFKRTFLSRWQLAGVRDRERGGIGASKRDGENQRDRQAGK